MSNDILGEVIAIAAARTPAADVADAADERLLSYPMNCLASPFAVRRFRPFGIPWHVI
ncbi:MAG: hypothetical protein ACYCOU_02310 [Sulfobacillus sp.]